MHGKLIREYTYYYVIRPQYELGATNGVKYNTRSDFYISLTNLEKNGGEPLDETLVFSAKNIAIYLDGYTYHATEENCRFYDDLKKRLAIAESNQIISYTLTWSDLEKFDAIEKENDNQSREFKRDSLFVDTNKFRKTIGTYKAIPYWALYKSDLLEKKNSFERLIWILSNPFAENLRTKKIALMLSLHQTEFGVPSIDESGIEDIIKDPVRSIDNTLTATNTVGGKFYIFPKISGTSDFASLKLGIRLSDLDIRATIRVKAGNFRLNKADWEGFWQAFNLVQESLI